MMCMSGCTQHQKYDWPRRSNAARLIEDLGGLAPNGRDAKRRRDEYADHSESSLDLYAIASAA